MKEIRIKKASGETAIFSEKKLDTSLQKAGASPEQRLNILEEIRQRIYNGMSTKEIYRLAFDLLKEQSRHLAAKYHLKRAIMELGPSGFPFEKFIAEVFRHREYQVSTGEIIAGRCVRHEIDVVAKKSGTQLLVECKFHSQQGIFCDVKIPLYIHARFNDVMSVREDRENNMSQGWIVTNTRFSADALQYGNCAGLKLMGWDYPATDSLKDRIDALQLYPVTCLTSLSESEKKLLLDQGHVLCQEIKQHPELLEKLGLKKTRSEIIMHEIDLLCNTVNTGKKIHLYPKN
jgi:hypothetical protein